MKVGFCPVTFQALGPVKFGDIFEYSEGRASISFSEANVVRSRECARNYEDRRSITLTITVITKRMRFVLSFTWSGYRWVKCGESSG